MYLISHNGEKELLVIIYDIVRYQLWSDFITINLIVSNTPNTLYVNASNNKQLPLTVDKQRFTGSKEPNTVSYQ